MIKNLSAGPGVRIVNNSTNWPSFYNTATSTGNTLVGQVRYNGSTQNMEVYDGMSWLTMMGAYPQVELNDEVHSILDWAREKMSEEKRVKELAKKYPALEDALNLLRHAEEQVKIITELVDTK